jgi:hypothetical protein
MWAVFQGKYRVTKYPMTEYDARNEKSNLDKVLSNLEVREIKPVEPAKPPKRKMKRWGVKLG